MRAIRLCFLMLLALSSFASAAVLVLVKASDGFAIVSPTDGSSVTNVVNFTLTAGLKWKNVAVYDQTSGTKIGADTAPANGQVSIAVDFSSFSLGARTLIFMAFDAPAGQSATSSQTITTQFTISASPDIFSLTSPADSSTISGTTSLVFSTGTQWLNVAVWDSATGTRIGADTAPSGGSVSFPINTTALSNGAHDFVAIAFDVPAGQTATASKTVTAHFTIDNGATPPPSTGFVTAGLTKLFPNTANPGQVVPLSEFRNTMCVSGNRQRTAEANYLGFWNTRGPNFAGPDNPSLITYLQATGMKVDMGLGFYANTQAAGFKVADFITQAKQLAAAGVLLSAEGNNESTTWPLWYNGEQGGTTNSWGPIAKAQRDAYAAWRADPVLKDYPFFSATFPGGQNDNWGLQYLTIPAGVTTLMPSGTQYATHAANHVYAVWRGASAPKDNAAYYATLADPRPSGSPLSNAGYTQAVMYGEWGVTWHGGYAGNTVAQIKAMPKVMTETGWWSGSPTPDAAGKVVLNILISHYMAGFGLTCIYDMANEYDSYDQFGFYDQNWNAKVHAAWMHNFTTILAETRAASTVLVDRPGFAVTSSAVDALGTPTVRGFLTQHSNGHYFAIIADERYPAGNDSVTINLGGSAGTVRVYDPITGTSAVQSLSNVSSVTRTMTDHPIIIEFF